MTEDMQLMLAKINKELGWKPSVTFEEGFLKPLTGIYKTRNG